MRNLKERFMAALAAGVAIAGGAGCGNDDAGSGVYSGLAEPSVISSMQQRLASCSSMDPLSCGVSLSDQCTFAGSNYAATAYSCIAPETAEALDLGGSEWVQRFQAPDDGDIVFSVGNATNYAFISVVGEVGDSPDPGNCVAANWYSIRIAEGDYTPGAFYYVIVDQPDNGADMALDFLAECSAVGVETSCNDGFDNDNAHLFDCYDDDCIGSAGCETCQPVDVLSCGDTLVAGDTAAFGSTSMVDSYAMCAPQATAIGPEYTYQFTATATEQVVFTVSAASNYPLLTVIHDQGNGCYSFDCVGSDYYSVRFDAVAGETYYLVVDGDDAAGFNYQASVVCPALSAEGDCSDGVDGDGDGFIDCRDPDCVSAEGCVNNTCSFSDVVGCGSVLAGTTTGGESKMSQYACMPGLSLGGPERVYQFSYDTGPDEREVLLSLFDETSYATVSAIEESPLFSMTVPVQNFYSDKDFAPGFVTIQNIMGAGPTPVPGDDNFPMYAYLEPDYQIDDGFCPAATCNDHGNVDVLFERMGLIDGINAWKVPALAPGESFDVDVDVSVLASWQYSNPDYNYLFYYAPLDNFSYDDNFVRGGYVFWGDSPNLSTIFYSYLYDIDSTVSQYADDTTAQTDCTLPAGAGCNVAYYGLSQSPTQQIEVTGESADCHPLSCTSGNFYATSFTARKGVNYYISVEGYYDAEVDFGLAVICDPTSTETSCSDGVDEDGDFLIDCDDPDCEASCSTGATCEPQETVDCGTLRLSGTTSGAGATDVIDDYLCNDFSAPGPEYAYTFTATSTGYTWFTTSNITSYVVVSVIEDVAGSCDPYDCLDTNYYGAMAYVEEGKTYHVVVDTLYEGETADYELSVVCNPTVPETDCTNGVDDDADFLTDSEDPDCQQ